MRCLALPLLLVLAACGDERGAVLTERAPEPAVAPPPTPEPARPTPGAPTRPSADDLRAARARCNDGWRAFGEGRIDEASAAIDAAIAVLERGDDHQVLGACLYNAGRVAESRRDVARARDLYERSLTFRANDVVRARLAALDTPPTAPERELPSDPLLRRLMQAEGTACARDAPCDLRVTASVDVDGGRLHVVSVRRDDGGGGMQDWDDLASAFGAGTSLWLAREQGDTVTWGPMLSEHRGELGMQREITIARASLRPLAEGQPPFLVIETQHAWEEHCCGGSASGSEDDVIVCATDRVRCILIPRSEQSSSEATDPEDDGYGTGSSAWTAEVTLDATGATVRTTAGTRPARPASTMASPLPAWGEGPHPWSELLALE